MSFKYDKDTLKENLSIEEVFDLVSELGGEPILKDNCIICKTICHNSDLTNASHKLYYYSNTHLFHCYTGCGDASFDIYDLVLRVNKTEKHLILKIIKKQVKIGKLLITLKEIKKKINRKLQN